ncbi:presqualene diphosphate synthase HpnD [Undibacterium oligocarboniphilum]|uniref:Presqualene diphosphate synthase HpnD n=1 Tax=Undibacterium oligocarboniphilum TaxID=666702 RepID=A0A850QT58_9BURK|nr:presqualene diphosphate synthase HpnD [Undibacterium oligocarboniphilum]MBC3871230.1 presqualene diphosphate synthase HpnD [Undibacterium oligocarboniphilum]NVO79206.1 presqualene diphosphate synthase HpnD [Undibacterium oligocarboniphilum]
MSPDEYCQQKAAESGSSFYYSFLFLPAERRRAITALYAFCREVDDVVDESSDDMVARSKLGWWRQEIQAMLADAPTHPVSKALLPHMSTYQLDGAHLMAIIDGMEMDLNQTRYLDFQALQKYCWHVAGVVGILSASIFGITNPQTRTFAEKLGLAFQMTNIIRDVGEDARKGRIYLPVNELQQFKVTAADILNAKHSPEFVALMQFQYDRAQALYDEALNMLPPEDRRAQRTGLIMAAIYRTLLKEIQHDDFHVLNQRISLTPIRKLWLAWTTYIRG